MRDKLVYETSNGHLIQFGDAPYIVNENDLRKSEWTYETIFGRTGNLRKKAGSKTLPIVVVGEDAQKRDEAIRWLLETIERDVILNSPGKLYAGEHYLKGYFVGSKNSGYTRSRDVMLTLQYVTAGQELWVKEATFQKRTNADSDTGIDYPYGFPFDYANTMDVDTIINTMVVPANFQFQIYGPVVNPYIRIAGNEYKVWTTVEEGEYLTVSSIEGTITKTKSSGEQVNQFHQRGIENYIFTKIPPGTVKVLSPGTFNFDVTIIEERSQPPWS